MAKRQGRDNTQWANRELAVRADHNLKLTEDIQRGLRAGEFLPYYEPIIDMQAGASVQVAAALGGRRPPYAAVLPGIDWSKADRRWTRDAA